MSQVCGGAKGKQSETGQLKGRNYDYEGAQLANEQERNYEIAARSVVPPISGKCNTVLGDCPLLLE